MSPLNANLPRAESPAMNAETEALQPRLLREPPPARGRAVEAWNCLVLSTDPRRRAPLEDSILRSGWAAHPCDSVGDAIRSMERWRMQLVVVDFGSLQETHRETLRLFGQRVVGQGDALLMVCDDAPEAADELWARQIGVWVYLPAPDLGESDDLIDLFTEALRAAKKVGGAEVPKSSR